MISRILIADDHPMFIDGLAGLINKIENTKIVGTANSGKEALEFISNHEIDLLITDINMPEMSGVELTRIVKEKFPDIKVLVLTMYNDYEIINEILMAEAEGYILKNIERDGLQEAIDKIKDNGTYYSNEALSVMMKETIKEKKAHNILKELSARELEIIKLIYEENTNSQIAEKLHISKLTVETHRKNILSKTGVRTTIGLIKFVIENKLV